MATVYENDNILEAALSQSFTHVAPSPTASDEIETEDLLQSALAHAFTSPDQTQETTQLDESFSDIGNKDSEDLLQAALHEAFASSKSIHDAREYQTIDILSDSSTSDNLLESALDQAFYTSESFQDVQETSETQTSDDENIIENAFNNAFSPIHPTKKTEQTPLILTSNEPTYDSINSTNDDNILESALSSAFFHDEGSPLENSLSQAFSPSTPAQLVNGTHHSSETAAEGASSNLHTSSHPTQTEIKSEPNGPAHESTSANDNVQPPESSISQTEAIPQPMPVAATEAPLPISEIILNNPENLLEAALGQAFSEPPQIEPVKDDVAVHITKANPEPITEAESTTTSESDEHWRNEYERLEAQWRADSERAREKAEQERARWEAVRAAEREEAANHKGVGTDGPWEINPTTSSVALAQAYAVASQSAIEESNKGKNPSVDDTVDDTPSPGLSRNVSHAPSGGSQEWEDVHSSGTSSFPSISFPDNVAPSSPPPNQPNHPTGPTSATLLVFDSSLSTRTRLSAFLSSVGINLLLPFVNGVMLGFGEIFAKTFIVNKLGWNINRPGSTAASVGLRTSTNEQENKRRR